MRRRPTTLAGLGPLAALALLGAVLGACGGTLYDAAGVPKVDGGATCSAPNHVCGGACVGQSVSFCGGSDSSGGCDVCTSSVGVPTCEAQGSGYICAYTCPAGQFRCTTSGCCTATAVAAGDSHACAITSDASLVCWGANDRGQIGLPSGVPSTVPNEVFPSGVTAVAAGARHTCAVHAGAVECWGDGRLGQLGTGPVAGGPTPVPAGVSGVTALALGTAHTCALTSTGGVRCWGTNLLGQLGNGDLAQHFTSKSIPVASGATALAAGGDTSCAVVSGAVKCWGADESGQTGASTAVSPRPPEPTPVTVGLTVPPLPAAAPPLSLAVGHHHACASFGSLSGPTVNIGLWCWGANDLGQFGNGATSVGAAPTPVQASKVDNTKKSIRVSAGGSFTCSTKDDIELVCGGDNAQQEAGAPTPNPAPDGLIIGLGGPLTGVSAGAEFACAVVGTAPALGVKCWGRNDSGQLGRDTTPAGSSAGTPEYVSP